MGKTDTGLVRLRTRTPISTSTSFTKTTSRYALCARRNGGARADGLASSIAAGRSCRASREQLQAHMSSKYIEAIAAESVASANMQVYEKSVPDSECAGMGTTLVAVITDRKKPLLPT